MDGVCWLRRAEGREGKRPGRGCEVGEKKGGEGGQGEEE